MGQALTCPTAQTSKTSSISFTAKGPLSLAGATAIIGTLTSIDISVPLPNYKATGVVQINLCPGGLPGGQVTITGTCGVVGTIDFTGQAGSGSYKGYSICR